MCLEESHTLYCVYIVTELAHLHLEGNQARQKTAAFSLACSSCVGVRVFVHVTSLLFFVFFS